MPDLRTSLTPKHLRVLGALAVRSRVLGALAVHPRAVTFGVLCLALSCARGAEPLPLQQQQCSCAYVTDFDAPGHVDIQVCAAKADLEAVAQSCATSSGVGAVSGCQCRPTGGKCGSLPPCAVVDLDRPTLPR